MIKDSYKTVFDTVIVWKLDRFSRNRYDLVRYKSVLKKNGVRVISATEKISEDSNVIYSSNTKQVLDELEERKKNLEEELYQEELDHPVVSEE